MLAFVQKFTKCKLKIDLTEKLTSDVLWSFFSFGLIAINGVILNLLIVSFYGSAALGLFNQVYAIFIIISQITVNGIHFSVLRTISLGGHRTELTRQLTSALVLTLFTAVIVVGLSIPLVNQASKIFNSEFMTAGIKLVLPGLVFFSLNKVILAFLNGQRRMKLFATYQLIRSIFLVGFLLLHAWLVKDPNTVAIIFSLSEGLLLITLLPVVVRNILIRFDRLFFQNIFEHLKYGVKATGGNILLELNTKIDILILGLFVSDSQVGVYSFAALFIEGFMQLPVIIRNNINPLLAAHYQEENFEKFKIFISSVTRNSYKFFVPLAVIGLLAFPLVGLVKTDINMPTAWLYFTIMMVGLLAASGYLPLLMTFNQVGKPGAQSLLLFFITLTFGVIVLGCTAIWGAIGTAVGVGLSYAFQGIFIAYSLKLLGKKAI